MSVTTRPHCSCCSRDVDTICMLEFEEERCVIMYAADVA